LFAPDKKEETKQNLYYLGWACFRAGKLAMLLTGTLRRRKTIGNHGR
jgi:hypothetical protein